MIGNHGSDKTVFLAGERDLSAWDYRARGVLHSTSERARNILGRKQGRKKQHEQ
jgi:hypothetical protein